MFRKILPLLAAITLFSSPAWAWKPIANTASQYEDSSGNPYSGAVLKAYRASTSTNITMATDSSGSSPQTSIALNANGYPSVSGTIVIPHIDEAYKLSLYPTQAAADSDTGALWTIDNLSVGITFGESTVVITSNTVLTQATHCNAQIWVTGTTTLTLPAISSVQNNCIMNIYNGGVGTVTLDADGAETINGAATWTIPVKGNGQLVAGDTTTTSDWAFNGSLGIPQSLSGGDIFYNSSTEGISGLNIGSTGQILMVSGSLPVWTSSPAGNYTFAGNNSFTGKVITPDDGELTIATGAITPTGTSHTVDTESDAATDDLDTISGGSDGQILTIRTENSARDVVITNAGNIVTPDGFDFKLLATNNTATLQYDGTLAKWVVLGRGAQNVVVQRVYATVVTSTSSAGVKIPVDDTIPQNTEGLEAITATITPTSATNRLRIRAIVNGASSGSNQTHVAALFQDSTANALQVTAGFEAIGNNIISLPIEYEMVAGTTSATTFKVRMGSDSSSTYTLNGQSGSRVFGGVMGHTMVIEEITP